MVRELPTLLSMGETPTVGRATMTIVVASSIALVVGVTIALIGLLDGDSRRTVLGVVIVLTALVVLTILPFVRRRHGDS
jgi:membrane protein YdbS with pleckstrin-like domain